LIIKPFTILVPFLIRTAFLKDDEVSDENVTKRMLPDQSANIICKPDIALTIYIALSYISLISNQISTNENIYNRCHRFYWK
jgi:hypothetical protein